MDIPIKRKLEEEQRLSKSIEEKNKEIEQKTKEIASVTEAAIKAIEKIKALILEAQEEYTNHLKATGKIKKV